MRKVFDETVGWGKDQAGEWEAFRQTVHAVDKPGPGGAHHLYAVIGPNFSEHPDYDPVMGLLAVGLAVPQHRVLQIPFQHGPRTEENFNGVTEQALLAILIDRLRSFQAGPFPARQNALALTKLEEANFWLEDRTRERKARGVEGVNAP